jgi:hypothetical protein
VNGKHEVRLQRIEERIEKLHEKMDELAENEAEAANATDIRWLKGTVRGLAASAAGISGGASRGLLEITVAPSLVNTRSA